MQVLEEENKLLLPKNETDMMFSSIETMKINNKKVYIVLYHIIYIEFYYTNTCYFADGDY